MRSGSTRTHNRHQNQQYRNLTEKFARINLSKRNSNKKSEQSGKIHVSKEPDLGSFTGNLIRDIPLIFTQEDRRMMREELQKEIIKREMEIIERRSRKSAINLPIKALENNTKIMVYPTQKKPLIIRPSTMIYGKFTFDDMERLKFIYQKLRTNNRRISHSFLKPFEMEGEYYIDSSTDLTFRKIKKNHADFLIWRMSNNSVIAVPKEQYGTFYCEDAYLIYAASSYGCPSGIQQISKEVRGAEYHVHFWLGESVTAEQAGAVAYKTVEIDALLGGCTVQHREVQGFESPRFKSYFRNGIRVLLSVSPSKFQFCDDMFNPRLYKIKGVCAPIITQLGDISWEQFNSGDVFILHTDTIMFVWVGRAASATEKSFAITASKDLHHEWRTTNTVFVDDGYEKTMNEDDRAVFELYLPLSERVVKSPNYVDDEDEENITSVEKKQRPHAKLYKCCEVKGKYRVTEIRIGPLNQDELISTDVFILDHEETGIWVWVGKHVRDKEHADAIRNARGFVKKKKYKSGTPVTRVFDTAEPFEFKMLFINWQDRSDGKLAHGQKFPVVKVTKFDANTMRDRPAFAAKSQLVDDGTGSLTIWRSKRTEIVELPKDAHGNFFNGDCYVLLYTYSCGGDMHHIIYYWLGAHCVPDEQDAMMEKCQQLEDSLTNVVVVRVSDGKEPPHFLQILKGRLRIFQGKGVEIDVSGKNTKSPKSFLLKVHGTATYNTKAIQVAPRASSLNSNHCYVLRRNNNNTIWCGNYSTGDNREMAKLFAGIDFMLILETHENEDFWNHLGGKRDFCMTPKISDPLLKTVLPTRLFKFQLNTDQIKADEIVYYIQKDLIPECIFLLDAANVIYIWVGNYCSKEDENQSFDLVKEYLKNDTRGRDNKLPFVRVKQGWEPPTFTGFFDTWNKKCWLDYKSYEEHRAEIEKEDSYFLHRYSQGECSTDFDNYDKYGVSILRNSLESLPHSVNPLNKELHLTYDDFVSLFKMEYQEFEKLPMWKRQELKKNVGLF